MPPRLPHRNASRAIERTLRTSACPSCNHPLRSPLPPPPRLHTSRRPFTSTPNLKTYHSLATRAILRLAGQDAASFLDGLLPCRLLGVGTAPIYTAFLTAQGRILVDVMVYPQSWSEGKEAEWFVECDEGSVDVLMRHLKKHKLRSRFKLEMWKGMVVGVDDGEGWAEGWEKMVRTGGKDPRPGMGGRFVVADGVEGLEGVFGQKGEEGEYTIKRMAKGLAEGQEELTSQHALPQESNVDLLGGIDFHKGCYLGQELTIRTHHTGVVRKRVLPVQLYESGQPPDSSQERPEYDPSRTPQHIPPPGSNMSKVSTRRGRSTGKFLGSVGNIGLALCRLEMMTDIQLTADATNYDPKEEYQVSWIDEASGEERKVLLKPFVPAWVREGIQANLQRKERRPKKAAVEEEEDDVD